MKLIDASVAVKFALDEEGSKPARALGRDALVAPDLILVETANAWWKALRCEVLTVADYSAAVASLASLFDALYPLDPVLDEAARMARELDHPVYDCIYLAYARKLERPLVTADQRLLNKVGGTSFQSLCEPLPR